MAKDDYDVIVFKILTYLYSCLKGKATFNKSVFDALISKQSITDEYLTNILRMMSSDGLIEGISFAKAWGNTYIMISDYDDLLITSSGIKYLKENSKMNEVKKYLENIPGLVADLIKLVF